MIIKGTNQINKIALGSNEIGKIYLGNGIVYGGEEEESLPYDAELEYLESSGTQYILTGIFPNNTFTFDTKVAAIQTGNIVYWGCRESGTWATYSRQCYLNSNTDSFPHFALYSTRAGVSGNWDSGITPVLNTMYEFTGMTVVSTIPQFTHEITLFALNNIGSINASAGICRIGAWKAYEDGTLVADFIPVRVGTIGYMYDKVTEQLFGNDGTGDFILGPDIS